MFISLETSYWHILKSKPPIPISTAHLCSSAINHWQLFFPPSSPAWCPALWVSPGVFLWDLETHILRAVNAKMFTLLLLYIFNTLPRWRWSTQLVKKSSLNPVSAVWTFSFEIIKVVLRNLYADRVIFIWSVYYLLCMARERGKKKLHWFPASSEKWWKMMQRLRLLFLIREPIGGFLGGSLMRSYAKI